MTRSEQPTIGHVREASIIQDRNLVTNGADIIPDIVAVCRLDRSSHLREQRNGKWIRVFVEEMFDLHRRRHHGPQYLYITVPEIECL